jgi:predicted nucleic acid-binding protein
MAHAQQPVVVVADTGPLLCAGALGKDGIELLRRRFPANGIAIIEPAKVHGELHGLSNRNDAVGTAAGRMFNEPLVAVDNRQLRQKTRDAVRRRIEAEIVKRNKRRGRAANLDPNANGGEIDAILVAKYCNDALLLCNERPARVVAKGMGLTVVTFADLLRAAMADGEIAASDVDQYLKHLPTTHFDIGIKNPTSVNINSLTRNPGL